MAEQRWTRPEASAAERIRDAAIDLYGRHGFDTVTIKDIAAAAEVSPSLIIHHFTSKAGLRRACDLHVTEQVRTGKKAAVQKGMLPRNYFMDLMQSSKPMLLYLFRAFATGGEATDALFDQLVEDSLEYMAEGEALGLVSRSPDPRRRAVILMLQGFGSLLLHRQLHRHLGIDPLDGPIEDLAAYSAGVMEIYTQPLLNRRVYQNLMSAEAPARPQDPPGSAGPPGRTASPGQADPPGRTTPPGQADPPGRTASPSPSGRTAPPGKPSQPTAPGTSTHRTSHKEHPQKDSSDEADPHKAGSPTANSHEENTEKGKEP
jgi:AcrR family transcriptional regulator